MSQPHSPVNRKNLRSSRGYHFSQRQPQKMVFFVPNSIFFLLNKDTKIFCQPQIFATANFVLRKAPSEDGRLAPLEYLPGVFVNKKGVCRPHCQTAARKQQKQGVRETQTSGGV